MNREIKFRTWDKQNKEFSEWTNRDPFFSTSEGKIFFWERTRKEDGSYDGDIILQDLGDRFVLQQYTGLKDKNGKEIYEGDIVEYAGSLMYEIRWNELTMGFVASTITDQDGMYQLTIGQLKQSNIIGNIFETPQFLQHV